MEISGDHHLGLEVTNCYAKYFDHNEVKLHTLIDKLSGSNTEIKIISDVMNKLSHAKQRDKKVDFSENEEMKRLITHIHKNNPTIFDDLIKGFPEYIPSDERELTGEEICVEGVLQNSLSAVNMGQIEIGVWTEDQIDIIVQGLDGELKKYAAGLNETLMKINENYDCRSQMTESARLVLKQANDLLESINRRMGR